MDGQTFTKTNKEAEDNNKQNKILPLTKNNFKNLNNKTLFSLSHNLNTTAVFILKGEIEKTLIKDTVMLHTFENYIETLKKSGNNFQNTYELEFINGYKEYILTDEQLKQSLIERQIVISFVVYDKYKIKKEILKKVIPVFR